MTAATFTKGAHTTKWIAVKDLSVIWADAQRQFNERHAKSIADDFDPDMFGTIAVTLPNGNGIYHIIDGRHRVGAVRGMWGDKEMVPCQVFDAEDPARAAKIFDQINTNRKAVQPLDKFRVRVTAGYETETAVHKIVTSLGYRIAQDSKDGSIRSVGALCAVYRQFGPKALVETLATIRATFGKDTNAVDANLIKGYGAFLAEFGNKAKHERLVEKVQKAFSPGRLIGAAKTASEMRRSSIADGVKYVLAKTYDHGLKTGKLLGDE